MSKKERDEESRVDWVGLIILSLSSINLFSIIWADTISLTSVHVVGGLRFDIGQALLPQVPIFVASLVFILTGLYMMKSGTKKIQ